MEQGLKILVTGANGQLGLCLRRVMGGAKNFSTVFTDVTDIPGHETSHLDITDLEAVRVMVRKEDIGVIVNCAAYTDVDAAESNPELAELLNAKAVENLAVAMKEAGGLLVHISTDYVFGGDPYNTPCREDQRGAPTGVYGLTKLHGEQAVQRVGCDHLIIRTAWLYSEYGRNFVRTMLNLTATRPLLKVVFDQAGTPTYAGDLAEAIAALLEDYRCYLQRTGHRDSCHSDLVSGHSERSEESPGYPRTGIYHFSNEGVCSWYDFAKMIAELAGNTDCDIRPCHSDEFPSPVRRPSYSVLDKTKIKETFGLKIPHWTDSLRKCVGNLTESQRIILNQHEGNCL